MSSDGSGSLGNDNDARLFNTDALLKCFVMMPFGEKGEYDREVEESNYVYKHIICKAIEEIKTKRKTSIEVIREADRKTAGSISKSILKNIASAHICIVDITGLNPNVFFELGIRYSLRHKTTILLKQEATVIPFDIQGYKCITYHCFQPDSAIESIVEYLTASLEDEFGGVDSLVFETFPNMQVNIPGILRSAPGPLSSHNVMPWEEWWERIKEMSKILSESFLNLRFVPTAVLGISNGGLLVADALGREVYRHVPILSLWADRWRNPGDGGTSCYIFDNDFNKATVQHIKKYAGDKKITLLLVDDIVATSTTIFQATTFLKKELGGNLEILFTPMYCSHPDLLDSIGNELLPIGYRKGLLGIAREDYHYRLASKWPYLPYEKPIG